MLKIKDDIDLNELRKFGFKTGKEWADSGERCLQGGGFEYMHGWWHKFLMDEEDENKIAYDVDKVVEELDAYITKLVGKNSALYQTIISIVKAGGIDA